MAESPTNRSLVRRARRHLDEWLYDARSRAFDELFVGDGARLSEPELALLDRIDSELSRGGRDGLWGADRYGILSVGALRELSAPRVVCVYHPEIPEEFVYPGDRDVGALDDATEERLNEALWDYAELVAAYAQGSLDAFLKRERSVPTE